MRIAIMTDSFYPTTDGVATAVRVTKGALEAMGHEVFVLAPDPGDESKRIPGVRYFPSVKFRKYEGYYLPILPSNQTEIIEEIKPDIIHIRGVAIMALKALFASHNTHVPTVLTYDTVVTEVIGMYSPVKLPKETLAKLATIYLRKMLKRPNAIAVPTPSTGRELEAMGVKPRMLEVVPTGIDTDRFAFTQEGRDEIRARHGLDGSRVVLFVGRLSFENNVDLLIRSLPMMDADVKLLIVGDGPAREMLEKTVDDTGVRDRVVFTGYLFSDDLVKHYSAADAFASPSVFETQGFTVQEAMSAGLVAACGNGRAFTDFIRDGGNGYLFDLNEEDCASAVMKALDAPKEVRDASMETALSYGIKPCTEKLVALYEKVLESKRSENEDRRG